MAWMTRHVKIEEPVSGREVSWNSTHAEYIDNLREKYILE